MRLKWSETTLRLRPRWNTVSNTPEADTESLLEVETEGVLLIQPAARAHLSSLTATELQALPATI
eukprot:jgi/Psemu1/58510/gm1.58510_g